MRHNRIPRLPQQAYLPTQRSLVSRVQEILLMLWLSWHIRRLQRRINALMAHIVADAERLCDPALPANSVDLLYTRHLEDTAELRTLMSQLERTLMRAAPLLA